MSTMLYRVRGTEKRHPKWSYSAVVYELNMRQFTPQGTFLEAMKQLERLKKLGVDVVWLMPIFPIGEDRRKGSLGSYYSIRDYRAVNSEFGGETDFRNFMQEAKRLGLKVILDWVANHTSRDAVWTIEHPEWYEWDEQLGEIKTPFDWTDTAKLNYSDHNMRQEMIHSMRYWVEEFGIDGFRCDMAMLVPQDFWECAVEELLGVREDIFMLAEAEGAEFHTAFDATYGWEIHHIFNAIASGHTDCYTLGNRLQSENNEYSSSAFRLHFTDNHDENSWKASALERFGLKGGRCFAALSFVLPGIPLIYNGQEAGLDRSLAFFEQDSIDWSMPLADKFREFYTALCELKHNHPALLAGECGGDLIGLDNDHSWQLFAIMRSVGERVVIGLFNLSDSAYTATISDTKFSGQFKELFGGEVTLVPEQQISLTAWEFKLFYC